LVLIAGRWARVRALVPERTSRRASPHRRRREQAVQEAFALATERWAREGTPANPRARLIVTPRHRLDARGMDGSIAEWRYSLPSPAGHSVK